MNRSRAGLIALAVGLSIIVRTRADEKPQATGDVFRIRIEDKKLVLRTSLPQTDEETFQTVHFAGFTGTAELRFGDETPTPQRRSVIPKIYKLEINNEDAPGQRVAVRVTWGNHSLDIQHSVHFTGKLRYIRLSHFISPAIDDVPASDRRGIGQDRSVELKVTEAGSAGREPVKIYIRGDDLFSMIRKYPQETEQFLRPLLRELGQEAVLAPEPAVAWQVFSERWTPPEKLKKDVTDLLPKLDAESASARDDASKQLSNLGPESALVLMQLDRTKYSAEQNSRIDAVIATRVPLTRAEADRLRSDTGFLLDCLNSDEGEIRAIAFDQLRKICRRPLDYDAKQDAAAREAAVARLREKLAH